MYIDAPYFVIRGPVVQSYIHFMWNVYTELDKFEVVQEFDFLF